MLKKMSILEEKLDQLIAKQDDIRPEDVTLEHIRNQRDNEIYPNGDFDFSTKYGGYNRSASHWLTRNQAIDTIRRAYTFLATFAKRTV